MNAADESLDAIRAVGRTPPDAIVDDGDEAPEGGGIKPGRRLAVSIFADKRAHAITLRQMRWDELVARIRVAKPYARKAEMPLIKLARFGDSRTDRGSLRHDANVIAISGIEGDYDAGEISIADAAALLADAGIDAVLYTSPNHAPARPRWRVLCPLASERSPSERWALVGRLNRVLAGVLAPESFALSQAFYIGRATHRDDGAPGIYEAQEVRGDRAIDEADELEPLYPVNGHARDSAASQARDDDPVLDALRNRGMLLRTIKPGTHAIRCPWDSDHTKGHGRKRDGVSTGELRRARACGLQRKHGHCAGRSLGALRAFLGLDGTSQKAREGATAGSSAGEASGW